MGQERQAWEVLCPSPLFRVGTRSLTIVFPGQSRTIGVNGWHWLITSTRKSTEEDKEGKCFLCHQSPITEHSGDNIDSTTTITQCRLVKVMCQTNPGNASCRTKFQFMNSTEINFFLSLWLSHYYRRLQFSKIALWKCSLNVIVIVIVFVFVFVVAFLLVRSCFSSLWANV